MNGSRFHARLVLPSSLESQLHDFRRRVWTIKMIEALSGAIVGVAISYLTVFIVDRVTDTPAWVRLTIFAAALTTCSVVPLYAHRWIWRHRRAEQLARLVSRRFPHLGDQLLGVIELVRNEFEQSRSRSLVEAAIGQVADETGKQDLAVAVPKPRHRLWSGLAFAAMAVIFVLGVLFPAAAENAWARFTAPWRDVPRFTFTAVDPPADHLVVPHGEPVPLVVHLRDDSQSRPASAVARIGSQTPVNAELIGGNYEFSLPGQIDKGRLELEIGDYQQSIQLEPMVRPELTSVTANIELPEYLSRPGVQESDIRGGALSAVRGSKITFRAAANRPLQAAKIDGLPLRPSGAELVSPASILNEDGKVTLEWQDDYGLAGQQPFTIAIHAIDDEAPTLTGEDFPRQRVVLDSETITFKLRAHDDFGVKAVGMEWKGTELVPDAMLAKGERMLAAGAPDRETLELTGTFCAQRLEIQPQVVSVRLFAEDYFPDRGRVYSPTYVLYVLTADQHAIWLTEQLSKWHKQSLEVRDREMQLYQTNEQLRELTSDELDRPDNRRRIEAQSHAERANGRRLQSLVGHGDDLLKQAMRNPEFGVGNLEKWAEMLQILKDISANRMPNVAELLKQSAQSQVAAGTPGQQQNKAGETPQAGSSESPKPGEAKPATPPPAPRSADNQPTPDQQPQENQQSKTAGNQRPSPGGPPKPGESKPPAPTLPRVVDNESTQQPPNKDAPPEEPKKAGSSQKSSLPVTTIASASGKKNNRPPTTPAEKKLDEAVKVQADLLAEFDRLAEELNKVLANLEGSTLVKRLKAASRQQLVIAGKIGDQVGEAFGRVNRKPEVREVFVELTDQEAKGSENLSRIMDDMQAYFDRRQFPRFKIVLDEMRETDPVGGLRQLGDDLQSQAGIPIAECEFWSDTFDRWADNLVKACNCKCPGCKSKGMLPPSLVLEAMQILEGEMNLREETRGVEQARPVTKPEDYATGAGKLQTTQQTLGKRVDKLIDDIRALPDGEQDFAKEIHLLGAVETVMGEAGDILGRPETGSPAIGAETEAIELLLQSKRINPKGGGGGGDSPGGGGTGTTVDSAMALVGSGVNEKEVREDRGITQTTGESAPGLPEEFRAGLDEYFNRLEGDRAKP
ncbi:MAG TPA: hypothetical protein VMF30_05995 [Pirellulales bacterium]|nr:hypothetical protein [Pirellulales bacterium]